MRRTAGILVGGATALCAWALASSGVPVRAAQAGPPPPKRMSNPAFLSPDHFDQSPPLREMPLLLGRDNIAGGAEPHQPNTINNSCADGTSGTFHSDESNDRVVVATTDGSSLAHGKTVRITATVWAWSTGSSDALDLYYAANANSPTWVYITTIVPPAGGAQNLSATYTLPTGSLQAVRANFRYLGRASSCSTGSYDDHDDLVFAVQ